MRKLLLLLILLCPVLGWSQSGTTVVTAQVKDTNGSLYTNCQWSVVFVGQNTTPGAGPYQPAALLNGQQGTCDSFGHFTVNLADNINTVTPTPSQWSFSICSASGYLGGPFCKTNILITITGPQQDLTSTLTPLMPLLPTGGAGGGSTIVFNGVPTGPCLPPQTAVNSLTGDFYSCVGGVWVKVGPSAAAGNPGGSPFSIQTNVGNTSFGGTSIGRGQVIVGTTGAPIAQAKPLYDGRDYGLAQNGVTDDTAALSSLLTTIGTINNADVLLTGPVALEPVVFPQNVTVRMQQQGAFAPISTSTSPGGAGFVQGTGSSNVNTLTSSCSVTLTGTTAGNTLIFMETHFFTGAAIAIGAVTDTQGGFYRQLVQQGFNFSSVQSGWAHGNITGGTVTVTVQYLNNLSAPVSVANGCIVWEISGMGPVVGAETSNTAPESNSGSLVMSAGGINTTTGALVIGFGGQQYLNQASCTPAAGFTQPAGSAGFISGGSQPSTGYGFNLCATYKLSSPGGSQTPTSTITNDPLNLGLNKYWAYAAVSVLPASSIITIQGPIDSPAKQIFTNSLPGQGTIDFTGNTSIDKVFPEWWGACGACSPSVNTPAIQAAVNAAYGTTRVNGSNANQYNRELHFSALYNINGTITPQHMNGAVWTGTQSFASGLNQTASNTTAVSTTCAGTYWALKDLIFTTNASQDLSHPLVDLNYTCTPNSDLRNEYLDFYNIVFNGNGVAKIGLRGAAAGGGAQYSTVNHYRNVFAGFTEAGYMLGAGSGCVPTTLATNAVAINFYNGDFLGDPAYGFENFGGGMIIFHGTTFENGGFFPAAPQSGYDICGQVGAAGEIVTLDGVRSESAYMLGGNGPYSVKNSFYVDAAQILCNGALPTTGLLIQGSRPGGHGVWYTVTAGGTWLASGCYPNAPNYASSGGTSTTLSDTNQVVTGSVTSNPPLSCTKGEVMTQGTTGSTGTLLNSVSGTTSMIITAATGSPDNSHTWTGGTSSCVYTPTSSPTAQVNWTSNQWIGYYVSVFAGSGNYQFATITANTSNTLTFAGGWQTDFPDTIPTLTNSDTSTQFIIEPAWGTQTSNNGVTWGTISKTVGGLNSVYNGFFPGLQLSFQSPQPIADRLQVTRSDWNSLGAAIDDTQMWRWNGVIVGTPAETGQNSDVLSSGAYRRWKNARNGITEIPASLQSIKGTSIDHWMAGQAGGGTSTVDTYWGANPNTAAGSKKGYQYLTNNSSGSAQTWQFNFDGTSTFPGAFTNTVTAPIVGTSDSTAFGANETYSSAKCETSGGATTLNTGATTTDTGQQCLPATAVIDAVVYRITTTITTAASFTIGDATTAARFCGTQSTLTAGTTGTCFVQADQTGAAGPRQASAVSVRVTTNVNPGAGAIRLIVFYHTWTPPTS